MSTEQCRASAADIKLSNTGKDTWSVEFNWCDPGNCELLGNLTLQFTVTAESETDASEKGLRYVRGECFYASEQGARSLR